MEKLIEFLRKEFPDDALEIQECIDLLNQCIDGSVESIKNSFSAAIDQRDYAWQKNPLFLQRPKADSCTKESYWNGHLCYD